MSCRGAVHEWDKSQDPWVCKDCGWTKQTRGDFVALTRARAERFERLLTPKSAGWHAKKRSS